MAEMRRLIERGERGVEHEVDLLRHAAPYWPAQLVVVVAIGLQLILPEKVIAGPSRFLLPALEAALLVGLAITTPRRHRDESRLRRGLAIGLIALVSAANAVSLALLVNAILAGAKTTGRDLLLGALAIWLTNILIFALWYWEMDGGGPGEREHPEERRHTDFWFPQQAEPELRGPDWRPGFVDYLYLAFTNASAFSPTDAMPVSALAKLLMLGQALISLLTVLLVAARAVNVLQ
jgi:uncharacterized membrane protein